MEVINKRVKQHTTAVCEMGHGASEDHTIAEQQKIDAQNKAVSNTNDQDVDNISINSDDLQSTSYTSSVEKKREDYTNETKLISSTAKPTATTVTETHSDLCTTSEHLAPGSGHVSVDIRYPVTSDQELVIQPPLPPNLPPKCSYHSQ